MERKTELYFIFGIGFFLVGSGLLAYGIYKYREDKTSKLNLVWIIGGATLMMIGIILFILALVKYNSVSKIPNTSINVGSLQ
jgi:dipeptide/tripeptide permease